MVGLTDALHDGRPLLATAGAALVRVCALRMPYSAHDYADIALAAVAVPLLSPAVYKVLGAPRAAYEPLLTLLLAALLVTAFRAAL